LTDWLKLAISACISLALIQQAGQGMVQNSTSLDPPYPETSRGRATRIVGATILIMFLDSL